MALALWLAVALPLAGALVARAAGARAGPVGAAAAALGAVPAWVVLAAAAGGERARSTVGWLPAADLEVGLRLDPLSAAMAATVGTVGLVVLLYSAGYFAGDERGPQAIAGLLAFVASMQGLVLADGYLALLVFWELVGVLSARLIAWNRADPSAASAATRAFLFTRCADFGFYAAVLALFAGAGTLAFGVERPEGLLGALVGAGLVLAAVGKSAQAPLQTWLMGAMAGPTPVSALLHSATMVAAGVYLLMRSEALLAGWPLELAGWIGAVGALATGVIALAQSDLKRVLAASTSSQLGLMFVGVAAVGPAVALFHLIAHAAAKTALFLASGIFEHDRGGTALEALRRVGRDDRRAFAVFAVGAAAIAAAPPLALFWSKESIAAGAERAEAAWFVLVLLAAAAAAAYMLRPALILWGPKAGRSREVARTGRGWMLGAGGAAALGAVALGVVGAPLARLLGEPPLPASTLSLVLSLLAVGAGLAAVALGVRAPVAARVAAARELYLPTLVDALVGRPVRAASMLAARFDRRGLDALVDGAGRATLGMARLQESLERLGIDRAVDGVAHAVRRGGVEGRRAQTGRLHEYLRDTVAGGVAVGCLVALTSIG